MKESSVVEGARSTPYLCFLFAILSTATFFEGVEMAMFSLASAHIRQSMEVSLEQWGYAASITRFGVVASFLLLLAADERGRRVLMMLSVVGFAVFNSLTAFAESIEEFVVYQFFARTFLTAEYALAVLIVGEEFPSSHRGKAIAALTSFATLGGMALAILQGYVLLDEGAPTTWIWSLGATMLGWFGVTIEEPVENWRALYILSALPLALILFLRLWMKETQRFEATKREASREESETWKDWCARELDRARTPWLRLYRRRTALVILLWSCVHVLLGPSGVYWVIHASETVGLTAVQIGEIIFWGYIGGMSGHFLAAWSIDVVGRKLTCAGAYIGASASIVCLYHTDTVASQYVFMFPALLSIGAAQAATHVYSMEIFPTEIRATGYGWTTNLFGRITEIVTPAAIGFLIVPLGGLPIAISVVAVGPIVGAFLVLFVAPETKGLTLEEVDLAFQHRSQ